MFGQPCLQLGYPFLYLGDALLVGHDLTYL
jgi:hypothetical protein